MCRGFSGLTSLDNAAPSNTTLYAATVLNSTQFTIPVDTTGQTWASGSYASGYDGMVYRAFTSNDAATYVYKLDFSSVGFVPGQYRVRIPGLGVSDLFSVDENIPLLEATAYAKGYYNQAHGYALNGWAGWTRPAALPSITVYETLCPGTLCSETGWTSSVLVDAEATAHAPWLTSNVVTGFDRSVRDAGDWDFHASRHCPMSYRLLEFGFRALPAAAKGIKLGFPNASSFIGSTYSAIDALDDSIHMALMQLENFRATQKGDGRVYHGIQFSYGNAGIGGGGGSIIEPSHIYSGTPVALAADPVGNFYYCASAAKMAQVFSELGFTTLAATWQTSAINAFAWANNLWVDYKTNGATGTQVQAYFNTTLGLSTKMGWSAAQFASWVDNNFNSAAVEIRHLCCAILYQLTGDTTYSNIILADYATLNDGSFDGKFAAYELVTNPRWSTDFTANSGFMSQMGNWSSRCSGGGFQLQPYWGIEGTGGLPYQQLGAGPGTDMFLIVALATARPTSSSDTRIKAILSQLQWQLGANQTGRSSVTGFGNRGPNNTLVRDRQAMGLNGRDMVGTAVYFCNGNYGFNFVFSELADNDGPANYTAELYTGAYDALGGKAKVLRPNLHRSLPRAQQYIDANLIIYMSEFVTQGTIEPSYIAARWRQAYGNNAQVTPSVQRIRRSVTTAA
jgi:endoglucanase